MGYSPRMSVQWQYYFTLKSRSMGHADLKVSSSVDHNRHDSITDTIELQINKGDKSAVFEAAVLIDRYIEEEYNASSGKWETIYQNGTNWGDMKYRLFTFNTEKTKMINYPQTLLSKFPMLAKLIESPVFAQLLKH